MHLEMRVRLAVFLLPVVVGCASSAAQNRHVRNGEHTMAASSRTGAHAPTKRTVSTSPRDEEMGEETALLRGMLTKPVETADIVEAARSVDTGAPSAPVAANSISLPPSVSAPRVPARLAALLDGGLDVEQRRIRLSDFRRLGQSLVHSPDTAVLGAGDPVEVDAALEHTDVPRAGGETNLVIRVGAAETVSSSNGPIRLHLVIDRRAFARSSAADVADALGTLLDRLAPTDLVQVVTYGQRAEEMFPLGRVGEHGNLRARLAALRAGGGGNVEAGLEMAYAAAARATPDAASWVVLVSAGAEDAHTVDPTALSTMAEVARVRSGCATTVIGIGSEVDSALLRAIAREGGGAYHLAQSDEELASAMVAEADAQRQLVASDVRVNVLLSPGVNLQELRAGGAQVDRTAGGLRINVPQLRAGDERRIVLRLRMNGAEADSIRMAEVSVRFRAPGGAAQYASRQVVARAADRYQLRQDARVGLTVADADLAVAFDTAEEAVRTGEATAASEALMDYVRNATARPTVARVPALHARTEAVARLATATATLLPSATTAERRALAAAFGALATRLF